ncbi:unnamed protein product [Durusdinium trenchii]|uniref:Protein kinase domain-containing protein n=1 Tax=Durusdinium trenchii TaxID=1381693 RepID=A0ABP0RET6_9DINO
MGASAASVDSTGGGGGGESSEHQLATDLLLHASRSGDPLGGRYVAGKLEHGRQVVVKVFKDVKGNELKAFKQRVETLCGLDLHLHLLLPIGWGIWESCCFVVYDMLDQTDAEKRLLVSRRGGRPFLWADRLRLAAAVASAVSHLRSCLLGSPHLNLKLSSVVFDRTGQVKLADLGFEGSSFEGSSELQCRRVEAGRLALQQVAELHDFGAMLLELLMPSSEATQAAVEAAQKNTLESVRPSELFERLGSRTLDKSAQWPAAAAHDLGVSALQCVLAEAEGTAPPPGMTQVAGMLLHQCQRSRHVDGYSSMSSVEVAFECVYSSQVEVQSLGYEKRFWRFPKDSRGPWPVGRQHQVEMFVHLSPDRRLCSSIGRTHFEIWPVEGERSWFWGKEKTLLRLVPLSQNPIHVDDQRVAYPSDEEVLISDGSKVSFSFQEEVFLTLEFLVGAQRIAQALRMQAQEAERLPVEVREGPASSYALQCEELLGEAADYVPKEDRRIPLSTEGPNYIGRMSHPSYFDKLQRFAGAQPFLPFISRRHLQVVAVGAASGEGAPSRQSFEVMNCSHNPISVAGEQLSEGQKHVAQVGETINLLGEDGHGGVAPYLSFRLLWLGAPATRSGGSLSRAFSTLPASSLFRKDSAQDVPDAASAWPSARPSARPPFQLILAGSAVVKGLAPALRVIDGHEGGISVGRAHQRELHEKAFVDGVLEYVSRDHFTVKAGRDGHFAVSALSQNPMWHSRGSRLQLLEPGHVPVRLQHADVLILYTGSEDSSHPEGPGSLGSLQWVFKVLSTS